ncbi:hypothetical protein HY477_01125 [Candidatus Uhrbacteria bacterium]|nr:hypothetical protein [Candidatus Uhrbacteria bacterium]
MAEPTIYTIPEEYYGGRSPKGRKQTASPIAAAGATYRETIKEKRISGKTMFIGVSAILFVLVVSGAIWYFTKPLRALPVTPAPAAAPVSTPEPVLPPPPVPPESAPEAPPTPETPPPPPVPLPPQPFEDTDSDGLSNAEELLYGGNPNLPDTDGDGFLDGHEVVNLYNPSGSAPERLEEAGFVRGFENAVLGYSIFYPTSWRVAANPERRSIEFMASEGSERIKVSVFDAPENIAHREWAVSVYGGGIVNWTTNKFGFLGIVSEAAAGWRGIFEGRGVFYVVEYLTPAPPAYKTTFEMMLNSLIIHE